MKIKMKNIENIIVREAVIEHADELNKLLEAVATETGHFGYELEEFNISVETQEHTINMYSITDNATAIHLYKKLRFKQEGILRKEFMSNGKFYDLIYMGLVL